MALLCKILLNIFCEHVSVIYFLIYDAPRGGTLGYQIEISHFV